MVLESGVVFEETPGVYKRICRFNSKIRMGSKKSFCLSPILKMMTSFLPIPGLITGMDLRPLKTGLKNSIFLVWNRVRIWRTGRHTPTKNSRGYPALRQSAFRFGIIFSGKIFRSLMKRSIEPELRPISRETCHEKWSRFGVCGILKKYNYVKEVEPYPLNTFLNWNLKRNSKVSLITRSYNCCVDFLIKI